MLINRTEVKSTNFLLEKYFPRQMVTQNILIFIRNNLINGEKTNKVNCTTDQELVKPAA